MRLGIPQRAVVLSFAVSLPLMALLIIGAFRFHSGSIPQRCCKWGMNWSWAWSMALYGIIYSYLRGRTGRIIAAHGRRCPSCEYALSGLPDKGTCPECAKEYDVAKILREANESIGSDA